MLTANVSKIKKVFCPTLPLFWKYFQKIGLSFSEWAYFLRSKNNVNFTKTCFFLNEAAWLCVHMCKYIMSQVFIVCYKTFVQLYIYIVIEKLQHFEIKNVENSAVREN